MSSVLQMIIPLHYQIDIMNNTTLTVSVLLIDVVYIYYWMDFVLYYRNITTVIDR